MLYYKKELYIDKKRMKCNAMKLGNKMVLVLIPAYNEQDNIYRVVQDLINRCPKYAYLIINDGSTDRTLEICREHGFPVLDLPVNLGLAGAFQAGMRYALRNGYEYAVQFDGDGQHRAEYIPKLLECATSREKNVVIASRFVKSKKGWSMREIGSRLIGICFFLTTGRRIKDPTSGMRLYDRTVMERLATYINYSPEPDTLAVLLKEGATVEEIPAVMDERAGGVSYLTFANSVKYMFYVCASILFVNWLR